MGGHGEGLPMASGPFLYYVLYHFAIFDRYVVGRFVNGWVCIERSG